jgi:iron complex transport system substrate-binding protein
VWVAGRGLRMRVVSLLPSATEVLCQIGGQGLLVGRSHECDYPAGEQGVTRLPVRAPVSTGGAGGSGEAIDPAAIDRQVRDQLSSGASLYTLDEALLADLRPDLILTQDLCEVCSIDLKAVRAVADRLPSRPRILSLNPHTVEDVLDDHLRVGEATGLVRQAEAAVVALRERLFRAQEFVSPFAPGPSVAFLEWTDPLFVGGHWTVQLIERAGAHHPLNPTTPAPGTGEAIGPQQAERRAGKSVRVPPEVLVATRPDRIVICPCGVGLPGVRSMAAALAREPWWDALPAVRPGAGRVALVDGNQMFNRPGPRLAEAFEWLVGWIQHRPELIPPGFPWEAWAREGAARD